MHGTPLSDAIEPCFGPLLKAAGCLLLALLAAGCSTVERVALGVCGNHVVEPGEDCDGVNACRTDCHYSCSATAPCPAGFGCDVSQRLCRSPKGSFSLVALQPNSATSAFVADFDTDGRDDLLLVATDTFQSSPSTVYFFDDLGMTASSLELPGASTATIADVTGDGRPDVVLGGSALFAYQSVGPRRFSPLMSEAATVSDDSRLYSADLNCDGHREILLQQEHTLFRSTSSGELTPVLDLGVTVAALNGITAVGSFARAKGRGCEMIALMDATSSRARIYGAANGTNPASLAQLSTVEIPDAADVTRMVFVDLNLDGQDDLIVQRRTITPEFAQVFAEYAAFGAGDGSFSSDPESAAPGKADSKAKRLDDPDASGFVAAGQFDGDPAVDFVPYSATLIGYEQAITVDLTNDGRADVAALTSNPGTGLDLLRSTPSGLFSRLVVGTSHVPRLSDVGDFDGDGQPDLLVTEGSGLGSEQTTVSVLFSPVSPGTARVRELAELQRIEGTAAGYLSDDQGKTDGFSDIAVLNRTLKGNLELGLLEGGTDRLLRANLALGGTPIVSPSLTFESPILGHFRPGSPTELAVVVAGLGSERNVLELLSLGASGSKALGSSALGAGLMGTSVLAVDLDQDGLDEIYTVRDGAELVQIKLAGEPSALKARETILSGGAGGMPARGPLVSADLNDDGHADLSVQADQSVWILLSGAQTSSEPVLELDIPTDECPQMHAHAWLQTDADAAKELAVLCWEFGDSPTTPAPALVIFDVNFTTGELRLVATQPGARSEALIAGDFNGDGIDDLAASQGEFSIFFGEAR